MKVVRSFPPNYADICKAIPSVRGMRGVVFTYGDTCYVQPTGNTSLSLDLEAHEETHVHQQSKIGAEEWWKRYLSDPKFRLEQELEAYRVQYIMLQRYPRAIRRKRLQAISKDLGGKMYGGIITSSEAKQLIIGSESNE